MGAECWAPGAAWAEAGKKPSWASMAVSAIALVLMPTFDAVPVFALLMVVAGAGLGMVRTGVRGFLV